jgi:hypothetical protein
MAIPEPRSLPRKQLDAGVFQAEIGSFRVEVQIFLSPAHRPFSRLPAPSLHPRDDLIHLGLVDNGRIVRIADGVEASAGDLIICRANDHHLEAGVPGRALANGDVLRIEAITRRGIMVRRMLDPDPATGQRQFTDRAFRYTGYQSSDLAYSVIGHSAQGATVHTGIALVLPRGEIPQVLTVASSRSADRSREGYPKLSLKKRSPIAARNDDLKVFNGRR